jgi:predicted benzoate:H+ symporter BenE
MEGSLVRVLVALLFAAYLWAQARAIPERTHRRRAFEMAAGALLAFAAFNGSLAVGATIGPLQLVIAAAGLALLAGAAVALVQSLSSGEMREQRDRIAAAAREYRERRAENREPRTENRRQMTDGRQETTDDR